MTMRPKHIIILIMIMLHSACIPAIGQTRGSVWTGRYPPATKPTNFQSGDYWVDSTTYITYRYSGGWYVSAVQLVSKKGDKGDPGIAGPAGPIGPKGADGICPPCPSQSSTAFLSVRWVNNWAELKQAFADMDATGYPRTINVGQDILGYGDSIRVTDRGIMWELNGNNCQIANTSTILYRDAKDAASSEVMIDMMPYIHNVRFNDLGSKRGSAMRLSSTYMGKITDCQFVGFRDPVFLPRAMSCEIANNRFWNNNDWFIIITYKYIPGGGPSTTQPNTCSIHDNCFRVDVGAKGAILSEGGSLCLIDHNVFEGGDANHNGSECAVKLDYSGSPNVKNQFFERNHVEVIFSIAAVIDRQNDGVLSYQFNYRQYGGTEIDIDGDGGNPIVLYRYQDVVANNATAGFTKWKSNGAIWDFEGLNYPISEQNPSMWDGGIVPYYTHSIGYGEGGTKYRIERCTPSIKIYAPTIFSSEINFLTGIVTPKINGKTQ